MHLLAALKKEGLPSTYKSLLKMEREGIIPQANNAIGFGVTDRWRLYSQEDIKNIVLRVKNHKNEK